MAYVKIQFIKHASNLVNYVNREETPGELVYTNDCIAETAAADFRSVANFHNARGTIEAVHVMQSWKSGNLEIWKSGNLKRAKRFLLRHTIISADNSPKAISMATSTWW